MASKKAGTFAARVRKLEAAEERIKTKLKRGQKLTAKPMSEILGVSWLTLREWTLDLPGFDESGVFVRGGNGIEWEFKALQTVRWLLKYFRAEAKAQRARNKELRQATGIQVPEGEEEVSFSETKELVNMTVTVVNAAERQKEYMLADEVSAFIDGYNQTVVNAIMGVKTKLDPNGNLPPALRKEMDVCLRHIAAQTHEQAQSYLKGIRRARIQQKGTGFPS